ncbi:hypothetical protein [Lentzea flava]|uniref:hypothetical protein n=1 Tax=Lentzea flava TaxID=103732 RepID=UPI00167007B0|nr:hypothetical protein [Lentzea flava]
MRRVLLWSGVVFLWDSIAQVLGLVIASVVLNLIASYLFERFKLIKRRWVKWVTSTSISLLLVVGVALSVQPIRESLLGKSEGQSEAQGGGDLFAAVSAKVEGKLMPLDDEKFQPMVQVERKRYFQVRVVIDSVGTDVARNVTVALSVSQQPQCLQYVKSTMKIMNSLNPSGTDLDMSDSAESIERLYRDGIDIGTYAAKANAIVSLRFTIDCEVPSGSMDIVAKVQARGSRGQPSADGKVTVYWSR